MIKNICLRTSLNTDTPWKYWKRTLQQIIFPIKKMDNFSFILQETMCHFLTFFKFHIGLLKILDRQREKEESFIFTLYPTCHFGLVFTPWKRGKKLKVDMERFLKKYDEPRHGFRWSKNISLPWPLRQIFSFFSFLEYPSIWNLPCCVRNVSDKSSAQSDML